jgi:hypothetical protein
MSDTQPSKQYEIGMVGLGVMGRNLLLNMADHGVSTDRSTRTQPVGSNSPTLPVFNRLINGLNISAMCVRRDCHDGMSPLLHLPYQSQRLPYGNGFVISR